MNESEWKECRGCGHEDLEEYLVYVFEADEFICNDCLELESCKECGAHVGRKLDRFRYCDDCAEEIIADHIYDERKDEPRRIH